MTYEGIAFYEQTAPKDGYAAVYRFFDTHDGGHLFTSSTSERDTLLAAIMHQVSPAAALP
jgi:hypothetical protein